MKAGEDREYVSSDIVEVYKDLMRDFATSGDKTMLKLEREFEAFATVSFGTSIERQDMPVAPPSPPSNIGLQNGRSFEMLGLVGSGLKSPTGDAQVRRAPLPDFRPRSCCG